MKRALSFALVGMLLAGALVVQAEDGKPGGARNFRVVSITPVQIGARVAVLAWDPPIDAGASPLDAYEIEWFGRSTGLNIDRGQNHVGNVTTATVSLRDGEWESIIEIRPRNAQGLGPASRIVIPPNNVRPGPVQDLTAEVSATGAQRGFTKVQVDWSPPLVAPLGVEYYDLYWTGHSATGVLGREHLATGATEATLQLQQGYSYALSIRAYGSFAQGSFVHTNFSIPDMRPSVVRDLATNVSPGTYLDRVSVGISWSPPEIDHGLPTYYEVSFRGIAPSGAFDQGQLDLAGTSWTFQGYPEMTYSYRVRAYNDRALGEYVVANVTTPATRPSAVTNLTAVLLPGTDADYRVSWDAPNDTAGLPVRNHKIWWHGFGPRGEVSQQSLDTAADNWTIRLNPGFEYLVRVRAETNVALGEFANVHVQVPGSTPAVQPGPVSSFAMTTGATPNQRVLSWEPPTDIGALPITGYVVRWYPLPAFGVDFDRSVTLPSSARQHTLNVIGGYDHLVSVNAITAGGSGLATRVRELVPVLTASAPQNATLAPGPGYSQLTFNWSAPAQSGGYPISGYDVRVLHGIPGSHFFETTASLSASATSYTFSGTQGANYRVHIAARNAQGLSPWATASAHLPVRTLGPIDGLASLLGPGPTKITLSWTPPNETRPEIPALTGYRIIVDHVHPIEGSGTRTFDIGLTDNYTFAAIRGAEHFVRVAPMNAAGAGTAVTSSILVTDRAPSAPLDLVMVEGPGYGRFTATWRSPERDGGLGIDDYRLLWIRAPVNATSGWNYETIEPTLILEREALLDATTFLAVAAVNGAGTGEAALASVWIPDRRPSEPRNLSATYAETEGVFAWEYPARDGNIGIDRYLMVFHRENATQAEDVTFDAGTDLGVTIPFEAGYTYSGFRIRSENGAGQSEYVDFPTA